MDAKDAARAFIAAWNIDDDEQRQLVLNACCSQGARFVSPQGIIDGLEAFSASVAAFRGAFPLARVVLGEPDAHSGFVRLRWETRWNDGREPLYGDDFMVLGEDGRIRLVVSFDGEPSRPS